MNEYISAFRKYADFQGRARRREFWMFVLVNAVVSAVLNFIDGQLGTKMQIQGLSYGILGGIYILASLLPAIALQVRRLHDTGRNGWWSLLINPFTLGIYVSALYEFRGFRDLGGGWPFTIVLLFLVIGEIVLLIFYAQDSQPGSNPWGPNPKGDLGTAAASY